MFIYFNAAYCTLYCIVHIYRVFLEIETRTNVNTLRFDRVMPLVTKNTYDSINTNVIIQYLMLRTWCLYSRAVYARPFDSAAPKVIQILTFVRFY